MLWRVGTALRTRPLSSRRYEGGRGKVERRHPDEIAAVEDEWVDAICGVDACAEFCDRERKLRLR
jgi:hypothetical protein